MALVLADRVRETTTSTGTSSITFAGALTGFQTFSAAVGNGNTTYYVIAGQGTSEWEVGVGTYTSAGNALSRDTVLSSSNAGALVNFSAGTKDVWVDYAAGKAVTTDTLAYPPAIGGTTPAAATFTTLTATDTLTLNKAGAATAKVWSSTGTSPVADLELQRGVGTVWGDDGYTDYRVRASGGNFIIQSKNNSTSTLDLFTVDEANNAIKFSPAGVEQMRVTRTASAVNYVQVTGAATGGAPTISATGSDSSVGLNFNVKNVLPFIFTAAGGTHLQITPVYTTGAVTNQFNITGGPTGNTPLLSAQGGDANVPITFRTKGTGAIDLAAGSSGVNISNGGTVTATTLTAQGSGYSSAPTVAITAPTTAGGVQATANAVMGGTGTITITNGGSGYTVNDVLTFVGGTGSAESVTVTAVSAGVITAVTFRFTGQYTVVPTNPVSVTGGTGSGATFTCTWKVLSLSITNAGSGYVEQPTVSFSGGGGSGAAAYASVGGVTTVKAIGTGSTTISNASMVFNTPNGTALTLRDTGGADTGVAVSPAAGYVQFLALGATNSHLMLASAGTNSIYFNTQGTSQTNQMRVTHTASAVNYVQVTGAATSGQPVISAQGSDTNISLQLAGKGSGVINLASNGNPYAVQIQGIASGANYNNWKLTSAAGGAGASSTPVMSTWGIDTNISMAFQSKGTGAIDLAAGSSGVNISNGGTVTAITRTAAGTGYTSPPTVAITAPTTAGGVQATASAFLQLAVTPTITSGGTGYSVNDVLTFSGGVIGVGSTASAVTVTSVSGGVITGISINQFGTGYSTVPTNPISVTGGTGTGATFTVSGWQTSVFTITNAGSGYVEQPTVSFSGGGGSGAAAYATVGSGTVVRSLGTTFDFYTPAGLGFRVEQTSAFGSGYWKAQGSAVTPALFASGTNGIIGNSGAGVLQFITNVTTEQFRVSHTASAVNYVQVTGAATGSAPIISAQGSDANASMVVRSKGTGVLYLETVSGSDVRIQPRGVRSFSVNGVTSGVNYGYVTGSIASAAPIFGVEGSDTNIDLTLTPKGTGNVVASTGAFSGTHIGTWTGSAIGVAYGGTGSTTLTANNVLLGNGTSALQTVAPGASGNVLTSNGTTWISQAASGGGATITDDTTTNATYYPLVATATSGSLTAVKVSSTKYTYNPSTGTLTSTTVTASSDERLKSNWASVCDDFIEKLSKVKHGTYDHVDSNVRQVGASAQGIQSFLPEGTDTDANGMLSLNYGGVSLVAAIKLSERLLAAESRINQLEKLLEKNNGSY